MTLYDPKSQAHRYLTYASDDRARIPLGFPSLDRLLRNGGLAPGDILMVIGRSSVGKTQFLQNILVNMVREQVPILDISLEMTVEQKFVRHVCVDLDLDPQAFEMTVRDREGYGFDVWQEYHERYPSYFIYKPDSVEGSGFDDFSQAVEDYTKLYGEQPRVVALDFLGLVARDRYAGAEQQRIPRLAAEVERWADACGVALILLHQTGRNNQFSPDKKNAGHIPLDMTDAMYGGEQNADYIVGLWRKDLTPPPTTDEDDDDYADWQQMVQAEKGYIYAQVLKNRHGPLPHEMHYPGAHLRWRWPSGRMEE